MVPDAQGNQVPLILPVYRSTSTDLTPLLILGAGLLGGFYLGPSATAGTAGATAGAGTGLTAGAGGVTGLTAGTASTGIGAGAIGTGLTVPAGFTLAPGVGASLAAGGAGIGLLDGAYTSSIGETGLLPGATEGFQASAIPPAAGMGGAQGLTVPVAGGTVTASGLIPTGATVPLGGPERSLLDNLRAANSIRNLLSPPTVQQQAGLPQQSLLGGGQARGVDFSPMYQNTAVGLLPTAEIFRRSLI
jgi:hypothetical protein